MMPARLTLERVDSVSPSKVATLPLSSEGGPVAEPALVSPWSNLGDFIWARPGTVPKKL